MCAAGQRCPFHKRSTEVLLIGLSLTLSSENSPLYRIITSGVYENTYVFVLPPTSLGRRNRDSLSVALITVTANSRRLRMHPYRAARCMSDESARYVRARA